MYRFHSYNQAFGGIGFDALGPDEVCFIRQDDKCRVPIGLTAAKEQSPLLMHVESRVSLPDHDWVVAERHKLIPSVYAGINIQSNGLVRSTSSWIFRRDIYRY